MFCELRLHQLHPRTAHLPTFCRCSSVRVFCIQTSHVCLLWAVHEDMLLRVCHRHRAGCVKARTKLSRRLPGAFTSCENELGEGRLFPFVVDDPTDAERDRLDCHPDILSLCLVCDSGYLGQRGIRRTCTRSPAGVCPNTGDPIYLRLS